MDTLSKKIAKLNAQDTIDNHIYSAHSVPLLDAITTLKQLAQKEQDEESERAALIQRTERLLSTRDSLLVLLNRIAVMLWNARFPKHKLAPDQQIFVVDTVLYTPINDPRPDSRNNDIESSLRIAATVSVISTMHSVFSHCSTRPRLTVSTNGSPLLFLFSWGEPPEDECSTVDAWIGCVSKRLEKTKWVQKS